MCIERFVVRCAAGRAAGGMTLLQHIRVHAAARPHATALSWASGSLDYAALVDAVDAAVAQLEGRGLRVLGLDLDNGPDWVVFDIAAMSLGICTVPLPAFFSSTQLRHALTQAGVQAVISDDPARLRARVGLVGDTRLTLQAVQGPLALLECISGKAVASLPAGVDKITFTSGTTGAPKAYCSAGNRCRPSPAHWSMRLASCRVTATSR